MADAGVFLGDRFLSGQRHGRELRLYLSLLGVQPDPAGVSGLCGGDADGVHHVPKREAGSLIYKIEV